MISFLLFISAVFFFFFFNAGAIIAQSWRQSHHHCCLPRAEARAFHSSAQDYHVFLEMVSPNAHGTVVLACPQTWHCYTPHLDSALVPTHRRRSILTEASP